MEEEVEDIESLDPPPTLEEPWCATCHAFTDYRRNGIPFNGLTWMADPIQKISRFLLHSMRTDYAAPIHLSKTGMVRLFPRDH